MSVRCCFSCVFGPPVFGWIVARQRVIGGLDCWNTDECVISVESRVNHEPVTVHPLAVAIVGLSKGVPGFPVTLIVRDDPGVPRDA